MTCDTSPSAVTNSYLSTSRQYYFPISFSHSSLVSSPRRKHHRKEASHVSLRLYCDVVTLGTNGQYLRLSLPMGVRALERSGYSLRHLNSTLYLLSSPHRRQYRGGGILFVVLFAGIFSSPEISTGGGQPCFSSYSTFYFSPFSSPETLPGGRHCSLPSSSLEPSPHRKYYRKEANCASLQLYCDVLREGPTRSTSGSLSPWAPTYLDMNEGACA